MTIAMVLVCVFLLILWQFHTIHIDHIHPPLSYKHVFAMVIWRVDCLSIVISFLSSFYQNANSFWHGVLAILDLGMSTGFISEPSIYMEVVCVTNQRLKKRAHSLLSMAGCSAGWGTQVPEKCQGHHQSRPPAAMTTAAGHAFLLC